MGAKQGHAAGVAGPSDSGQRGGRDGETARLREILDRLQRQPNQIDECLDALALDTEAVYEGWRSIFANLMSEPGRHTNVNVKVLALGEYLRVLEKHARAPSVIADATEGVDSVGSTTSSKTIIGIRSEPSTPEMEARWTRLTANRPVGAQVDDEIAIDCWLGACPLRLRIAGDAVLIDPSKGLYLLRAGKNFVGRASYNDVVIDPRHNSVSRQHLIIEISEQRDMLVFTDLSRHGTFLPRDLALQPR